MSLIISMAIIGGLGMVAIWAPLYPPARHPHMRAMDRLRVQRTCEWCGAEVDAFGHCLGSCQGEEWDR